MTINTTHKLVTGSWSSEVERLETAVGHMENAPGVIDCDVALFELVPGGKLHVNVTHKRRTKTAAGWSGPGQLPQGFVHNRTFDASRPNWTVRRILEMVSAPAIG